MKFSYICESDLLFEICCLIFGILISVCQKSTKEHDHNSDAHSCDTGHSYSDVNAMPHQLLISDSSGSRASLVGGVFRGTLMFP